MMWPLPGDGWNFQGARRPGRGDDADVRLTYEVADALLGDERTRRQRVTVEVQNAVVLLSGTVQDQQTAEVVIAVVRQVPGVRDICNSLRTRVTETPEADHGALATSGQRESEVFDEIVAAMSPPETSSHPRESSTRRMPGQAHVLLVAVVLLLLGWLVMKLGWPGLLIACGVAAGMVEMRVRRRRRENRK
jgi:hypothetical protein